MRSLLLALSVGGFALTGLPADAATFTFTFTFAISGEDFAGGGLARPAPSGVAIRRGRPAASRRSIIGWTDTGATRRPTAAVKTTSDITRGLSSDT